MASRLLSSLLCPDAPVTIPKADLLGLIMLTERELELLCWLTHDLPDAETADRMCTSTKTIANYKNRIGDKLNLKGHRAVVRFALQRREWLAPLHAHLYGLPMQALSPSLMAQTQAGGRGVTLLASTTQTPLKIGVISPYFLPKMPCTFVLS